MRRRRQGGRRLEVLKCQTLGGLTEAFLKGLSPHGPRRKRLPDRWGPGQLFPTWESNAPVCRVRVLQRAKTKLH